MEDATLKDDLMSALEWEPDIDLAMAGASVTEGLVTLFGYVSTLPERHAVEQAVLRVRGVTAVTNEIEVTSNRSHRVSELTESSSSCPGYRPP